MTKKLIYNGTGVICAGLAPGYHSLPITEHKALLKAGFEECDENGGLKGANKPVKVKEIPKYAKPRSRKKRG